jgi:hypothetical protein
LSDENRSERVEQSAHQETGQTESANQAAENINSNVGKTETDDTGKVDDTNSKSGSSDADGTKPAEAIEQQTKEKDSEKAAKEAIDNINANDPALSKNEVHAPIFSSEEMAKAADDMGGTYTCRTDDRIEGPDNLNISTQEIVDKGVEEAVQRSQGETGSRPYPAYEEHGENALNGAISEHCFAPDYFDESCRIEGKEIANATTVSEAEDAGNLSEVKGSHCDDMYIETQGDNKEDSGKYVAEVKTFSSEDSCDRQCDKAYEQLTNTMENNPQLDGGILFGVYNDSSTGDKATCAVLFHRDELLGSNAIDENGFRSRVHDVLHL